MQNIYNSLDFRLKRNVSQTLLQGAPSSELLCLRKKGKYILMSWVLDNETTKELVVVYVKCNSILFLSDSSYCGRFKVP
jgi:hypothetical protein